MRVEFYLGIDHRTDWFTTYPFPAFKEQFPHAADLKGHEMSKGDIIVGNDVWIGNEALLLSGVTVGDGAVIGSRAVVAHDVPPYSVVVGNPARVCKQRFDKEIIEYLLNLKWWNFEHEKINYISPYLCSANLPLLRQKISEYDKINSR